MPSKSPAQHRLMQAAAHTKGGYGGVPQSVGKEFTAADARSASRAGVDKEAIHTAEKIAPEHRKHMAAALRKGTEMKTGMKMETGSMSTEGSSVGGASAG